MTDDIGRLVWLELNAQRVTLAARFYQELFGWRSEPLHASPWGSIPMITNGNRTFGNQFMAMGGFSTPRWIIWFSGDLDHALERIPELSGTCNGKQKLGTIREEINGTDPSGVSFSMMKLLLQEVPEADAPGDPCMAEYWGPDARAMAPFYAGVLGMRSEETEKGATLFDGDIPRLFLRETEFDIHPPRWIPYFRTASVGGDLERARRAGAVSQIYEETVPGLGRLVILADPANAYFGLVDPGAE